LGAKRLNFTLAPKTPINLFGGLDYIYIYIYIVTFPSDLGSMQLVMDWTAPMEDALSEVKERSVLGRDGGWLPFIVSRLIVDIVTDRRLSVDGT